MRHHLIVTLLLVSATAVSAQQKNGPYIGILAEASMRGKGAVGLGVGPVWIVRHHHGGQIGTAGVGAVGGFHPGHPNVYTGGVSLWADMILLGGGLTFFHATNGTTSGTLLRAEIGIGIIIGRITYGFIAGDSVDALTGRHELGMHIVLPIGAGENGYGF